MDRLPAFVFGADVIAFPSTTTLVERILIVPPSRSTASQRSPHSSPRRMPRVSRSAQPTAKRSLDVALRNARASATDHDVIKYRPDFPDRFGSFEDGQAHCARFFRWYNDDHRHSGIGLHTPADVHYGRAEAIREQRGVVLLDAYATHPERFVRKIPTPPALPEVAWINQPEEEATDSLNR